MEKDYMKERGRALEETFFAKRNQDLLAQLREKTEQEANREAIRAACGIQEEQVLEQLVRLNISPETMAAFALVPLVIVAWADGHIAPEERTAVLQAAESKGFPKENASYRLLERWLNDPPPAELLPAWKAYTKATCEHLSDDSCKALRDDILGRAQAVAQAAGGILGMHSVSKQEKKVLDDLAEAF